MRGFGFLAALALVSACSEGRDQIADRVEEDAADRAAGMEAASRSMANALQQNIAQQQADGVRRAGEERAEAIRESQLDAEELTEREKDALIRGENGTAAAPPR